MSTNKKSAKKNPKRSSKKSPKRAAGKASQTAKNVEPEVVKAADQSRPAQRPPVDPFDRLILGEFPWPAWFGRRWPDRLVGDFGTMLDHMKIEEFMDDDTLVVRGELPGVDPDDIEISTDNGQLTVKAKRTAEDESTVDGYRSEFHYGSISRTMTLPDGADVDDVEASYGDGILELRIPVERPDGSTKKIKVNRR